MKSTKTIHPYTERVMINDAEKRSGNGVQSKKGQSANVPKLPGRKILPNDISPYVLQSICANSL